MPLPFLTHTHEQSPAGTAHTDCNTKQAFRQQKPMISSLPTGWSLFGAALVMTNFGPRGKGMTDQDLRKYEASQVVGSERLG